ncbi:hypothetical protein [Jeotgalibaca sp. A122]|uniref:hypothetical protein n=1 Tax=Jeotgalibaca sp. A122 TaxID=3457322 RepID=UPI003FD17C10
MKQCYFCNHSIPDDAVVCPMCGMEVIEEKGNKPFVEKQSYKINVEASSRKDEKQFSFRKGLSSLSHYGTFLARKTVHPLESIPDLNILTLYGYLTLVISAVLSAGIVTRVVGALENTYQVLSSISILPVLSFSYSWLEWLIKLSLFFFLNYLLYGILSYLFQKNKVEGPSTFGSWLAEFSAMNALYILILLAFFLLSFVAPIGLGIPALLFVAIHQLSYLVSFLLTIDNINANKKYYQGLISTSIHFLLMVVIGYLLIKI